MLGLSASACPFPTQFPEADPSPNQPPVIDAERTSPYYNGGNLSLREKPVLTIWVNEPDLTDELNIKVVKNLDEAISPDSQIPVTVLLTDAIIGPNDVPPPEENEPESVRTKQFELQVTPCPETEPNTTPVLTICVADRPFRTYSDTRDPCQPDGRDEVDEPENRGYTARYTVVFQCGDS